MTCNDVSFHFPGLFFSSPVCFHLHGLSSTTLTALSALAQNHPWSSFTCNATNPSRLKAFRLLWFSPVFSSATPVIATPSSKRKLPLESGHSFGFSSKKRRSMKHNLGMELLPNTLFSGTSTPGSGIDDWPIKWTSSALHSNTRSSSPLFLFCVWQLTARRGCWTLLKISCHQLGGLQGTRPRLWGGRAGDWATDTPSAGTHLLFFFLELVCNLSVLRFDSKTLDLQYVVTEWKEVKPWNTLHQTGLHTTYQER